MIYICALVGSNKHNIQVHVMCIKIVEYLHCCLLRVTVTFTPDRKYVYNIQNCFLPNICGSLVPHITVTEAFLPTPLLGCKCCKLA